MQKILPDGVKRGMWDVWEPELLHIEFAALLERTFLLNPNNSERPYAHLRSPGDPGPMQTWKALDCGCPHKLLRLALALQANSVFGPDEGNIFVFQG